MRAGREHAHTAGLRLVASASAQLARLGDRLRDRTSGLRSDLDRRLEQLRPDALVGVLRLAEHLLVPRRQLIAVRVHELELLLDAERERSEERRVGKECRSRWS